MDSDSVTKLNSIINELIENGEDREEMAFWKNIFPGLSTMEQNELLQKLETELQTLKDLG